MPATLDVDANSLLRALLRSAPGNWQGKLELVGLPLGAVLHEPAQAGSDVFFPVTAVVSLLCVLADGNTAEVAVIGHEGVVGIWSLMGNGMTPTRAVVQCAGTAIRLPAAAFKEAFVRQGEVARMLLRFTQALIAQMSQTAVCNRHHSIDQHLCRWLLLMLDRHRDPVIEMTHELISSMLGVRRESVSTAAGRLQRLGAISYWRGRITVLDRALLEQRVCECYGVVRAEYDRARLELERPIAARSGHAPAPQRQDPGRLHILRRLGILDTPPEAVYDALTLEASRQLRAPIAMLSFLDRDRDWFKSCIGFLATESAVETSFSDVFFSIDADMVVVEDTRSDARFASHSLVRGMPFIRFYAAARLVVRGATLGTLCIYDLTPRRFAAAEVAALKGLASTAMRALEGRTPGMLG